MIALDTNALVRLLAEDDMEQAKTVQSVIQKAESDGEKILILTEVLVETVWVLESVYHCSRKEIADFLDRIANIPAYYLPDALTVNNAVSQYKNKGDFADLIIVEQAQKHHAEYLFSFDKKLKNLFPDYVINSYQCH